MVNIKVFTHRRVIERDRAVANQDKTSGGKEPIKMASLICGTKMRATQRNKRSGLLM